MGASVLPRLPLAGGDRNRTSPFAFTGNKFEFRALGSLDVARHAEHDPQHDRRRGDRRPRRQARGRHHRRRLDRGSRPRGRQGRPGSSNKRIVFSGDNYSDEWHAEAETRGLANLKQSPDALPWLVEPSTVEVFGKYKVLSERELHSRYEVAVEQYVTTINIEAETAASIARTMLLPAAIRWLGTLESVKAARHREADRGDRRPRRRVRRHDLRARGRERANHPEDDSASTPPSTSRPRSWTRWPPSARSPTSSSGSSRTTSGRSRSTRRSSSSSSALSDTPRLGEGPAPAGPSSSRRCAAG